MNNSNWAAIDYILNKGCPYLILLFFVFWNLNLADPQAYFIIMSAWLIDRFSFKVGYSMAFYENHQEFKEEVDRKIKE